MAVLVYKKDVVMTPTTPILDLYVSVLMEAVLVFGRDFTITCGRDSHGPDDPHTLGKAIDLRAIGMTDEFILELLAWLKAKLGPHFYIQYETSVKPDSPALRTIAVVNAKATAKHFHIQFRKGLNPAEFFPNWPSAA